MLIDVLIFGTILYWMVGLDATLERFLVFISILFTFSVLMNQMLAVFAAVAPTKSTVQVMCACLLLLCILFGGFIVPPNVIPNYYEWVYWWNPFAWAYRALLVNEFQSGSYADGDTILSQVGFLYGKDKDKAFGQIWVLYWFVYMIPNFVVYVFLASLGLMYSRQPQNAQSVQSAKKRDNFIDELENVEGGSERRIEIPFRPVTITFEAICYDVQASKGSEQLRLLHNVNGIFRSGRMCALMGASGAGKHFGASEPVVVSSVLTPCFAFAR